MQPDGRLVALAHARGPARAGGTGPDDGLVVELWAGLDQVDQALADRAEVKCGTVGDGHPVAPGQLVDLSLADHLDHAALAGIVRPGTPVVDPGSLQLRP